MDVRNIDLDLTLKTEKTLPKWMPTNDCWTMWYMAIRPRFVRQDEMEAAWRWVDPILATWSETDHKLICTTPVAGSCVFNLATGTDGNVWQEGPSDMFTLNLARSPEAAVDGSRGHNWSAGHTPSVSVGKQRW